MPVYLEYCPVEVYILLSTAKDLIDLGYGHRAAELIALFITRKGWCMHDSVYKELYRVRALGLSQ